MVVTVEMVVRDKIIMATCKQQPYRYGKQNFENLLYDLSDSFGGVCSPGYFDPPLDKQSQRALLLANHEKYARSLNFPIKKPKTFRYMNVDD